jgi:hypothetical protein
MVISVSTLDMTLAESPDNFPSSFDSEEVAVGNSLGKFVSPLGGSVLEPPKVQQNRSLTRPISG